MLVCKDVHICLCVKVCLFVCLYVCLFVAYDTGRLTCVRKKVRWSCHGRLSLPCSTSCFSCVIVVMCINMLCKVCDARVGKVGDNVSSKIGLDRICLII